MSRRREEQITDPCLVVFVDAGGAPGPSDRRRAGVIAAARASPARRGNRIDAWLLRM